MSLRHCWLHFVGLVTQLGICIPLAIRPIRGAEREMTVTGRCACGAVQFTLSGPLRPVINCHCYRCRRWTGHFMAATNTAVDDLSFDQGSDSVRWWTPDEEPTVAYGFCAGCGGSLFWRSDSEARPICGGCRYSRPADWPIHSPCLVRGRSQRLSPDSIPTFPTICTIPVPTASKAKTPGNPPSCNRG